jgi:hypothetical protein
MSPVVPVGEQVHTTGMDIEQLMNAHAALTLGKDMVFRDYAQGAFRLRKIGQGQRLTLHIIPEVHASPPTPRTPHHAHPAHPSQEAAPRTPEPRSHQENLRTTHVPR